VFTPPAEPALQDDGFLTASEVLALKLNADWVVLSTCNTATADSAADGLSSRLCCKVWSSARASGFDGRVG
jgi:CHAT domain-containing protein